MFSKVAEPWQWSDVEIFNKVVGNLWGRKFPIQNIWLTRPRGHDKTSSIARLALWCILFHRPNVAPLNIYVAAVDKEQAGILLDSLKEVVQLNFPGVVKITRSFAKSFGGKLNVLSSDVSSSYGLKANMIVFDELTHWTGHKSKGFFEALWSGRSKIQNCITIIITNSGYRSSWQYQLLQEIKHRPDWYIYDSPGRLASWHSNIDSLMSGLSPTSYRRLILNEWVDDESVSLYPLFQECITDKTPDMSQCSHAIISIDYASTHDLTAIATAYIHDDTIYIIDIDAGHWPQDELEKIIVNKHRHLSQHVPTFIVADQYQMEYMKTRLRNAHGIRMELIRPTASYNKKAINTLFSAMRHHKVQFTNPYMGEFRGQTLHTEMKNTQVDLNTGRISATAPGTHDDRLHAVIYAVNFVVQRGYISIAGPKHKDIHIGKNLTPHIITDISEKIKNIKHATNVFGVLPNNNAEDRLQFQLKQQLDEVLQRIKERRGHDK